MRSRNSIRLTLATTALCVAPVVAAFVMWEAPAWAMMWAVAAAIFAGCKLITLAGAIARLHSRRTVAYLLAWPGLDADAFLGQRLTTPALGFRREASVAVLRVMVGIGLIVGATVWIDRAPLLLGWAAMVGMILLLHFGLFHLISCAWRAAGVSARPLMDRPLASRSVGEFWGRRWNTAFRDITHRYLFTPLTRAIGVRSAIAVGFLISGLVHELVITLPARGGYGLPTLFFTWQGVAILVERTRPLRRVRGRAWTILCLAPAVAILFPPVFVERVIAPMLRAIGHLFM